MAEASRSIIYIGDPMCSWCWGFVPVLEKIQAEFGEYAEFKTIVGGLRPGIHAQRMTTSVGDMIRSHWEHVEEASGQPFDYSFFDRKDFLYDTEPAAKAVVTVRHLKPEVEFDFFKDLQRAFYTKNIDITLPGSYLPYLAKYDISESDFQSHYDSIDIRKATTADFQQAKEYGVRGFPSVILRSDAKLGLLTAGYQSYDRLGPAIKNWFSL